MDPGALGSLGVGTGFALAAKLANPKKEVLCYYGDGSFGMTAFDMETANRFGAPYPRGRRQQLGDEPDPLRPDRQVWRAARQHRQHARRCAFSKFAHMLGGYGEEVREPGQIQAGTAAGARGRCQDRHAGRGQYLGRPATNTRRGRRTRRCTNEAIRREYRRA